MKSWTGCVERFANRIHMLLIRVVIYRIRLGLADDAAIDHIRTGGEIDLLNSRWASSMSSRSLVVHSPSPQSKNIPAHTSNKRDREPSRATTTCNFARADLHAGIVNVNPVVGETAAVVHDQSNREEIAVPQSASSLQRRLGRRGSICAPVPDGHR